MNVIQRLGVSFIVATAVVASTAPVAHAGGNVANEKTVYAKVALDTCSGEHVELTGTEHFVMNETGGGSEVVHVDVHLTGADRDGTPYVLNGHQNFNVTTASFHSIVHEVLVSLGSAPNQTVVLEFTAPPPALSYEADCHGAV